MTRKGIWLALAEVCLDGVAAGRRTPVSLDQQTLALCARVDLAPTPCCWPLSAGAGCSSNAMRKDGAVRAPLRFSCWAWYVCADKGIALMEQAVGPP